MPFQIVIADADVAHQQEVARNVEANVAAFFPRGLEPHQRAKLERLIAARHPPRPVGTVHAELASFDCPDGMPNCRNCGDPDHHHSCRAAGHCPRCGQAGREGHGVAFQRYLAAAGYVIVEVPE